MFLRLSVICLQLMFATSLFADQNFIPYVKDNILYFDPPGTPGARAIKNIKILSYSVKYLGGKPFCDQEGKADYIILGPHLDGDQYGIQVNFTCPISDPKDGCTHSPWSKCAVDETLPPEYPIAKCKTDSPSATVSAECKLPSVNSAEAPTKQGATR